MMKPSLILCTFANFYFGSWKPRKFTVREDSLCLFLIEIFPRVKIKCLRWGCKIYFKWAWIYTKRHLTKKKTNKNSYILTKEHKRWPSHLKGKKEQRSSSLRLTLAVVLFARDDSLNIWKIITWVLCHLRHLSGIQIYHLLIQMYVFCVECFIDSVWFFRRIRSALWPPLCRVRSWERLRRLSEWWRRKTTQPPTMKRTSTKSTSLCRQPSGRQISKR